jgi:hypothetical protein
VALVLDHHLRSQGWFGVVQRCREIVGSTRLADVSFDVEVNLEGLRPDAFLIKGPDDPNHTQPTNFYGVKHTATVVSRQCCANQRGFRAGLATSCVVPRPADKNVRSNQRAKVAITHKLWRNKARSGPGNEETRARARVPATPWLRE